MVARGTGCGFVKITAPRISKPDGRPGWPRIDFAAFRGKLFLDLRQERSHRGKRFSVRGNDRGPRSAWFPAGADRPRAAGCLKRNCKGTIETVAVGVREELQANRSSPCCLSSMSAIRIR